MMRRKLRNFPCAVLLALVLPRSIPLAAQTTVDPDPCGYESSFGPSARAWAYDLNDFAQDLQRWQAHPYVTVTTIGQSVQNRTLHLLTITNPSSTFPKKRLSVHARTHPIEAEGSFVTREMIDELLSDSPLARLLMDNCVFQFVPMYNPDGVALQKPRENANGVDIESNWNTFPHQPEVASLKQHFTSAMQVQNPIEIALNMHSAYNCKRYFVYHAAAGTSVLFTQLEQRFIHMVRARFPGGIEPYDYFVSWTGATPRQYPESWFWLNHQEKVMALTYEDMNCPTAGEYDRTARALLGGSGEYLGVLPPVTSVAHISPGLDVSLDAVYPSPVHAGKTITVTFSSASTIPVRLLLSDMLGRELILLWDGHSSGTRTVVFPTGSLPSGTYAIRLLSGVHQRHTTIVILQ